MAQFFIITYNFFKKHKFFFFFFIVLLIVTASTFVYNIKLEEDINKAIPGKVSNSKINLAFQQTGLSDKVLINISFTDSNKNASPDSLIIYADELLKELQSEKFKPYLKNIFYKTNDSVFSSLLDVFYNNYPLFLSSSDLLKFDSLTSEKNIEKSINNSYQTLISPASFAFKDNITNDPIGIVAIAFNKLKQIAITNNYDTYNNYIFSKNHKNLLIFANTVYPSNKTSHNINFADLLYNTINQTNAKFKNTIKAEAFGSSLIAVSNAQTLKRDIILTFSIASILLILIISLSVKDKKVFLIIFIPTILAGGIALSTLTVLVDAISVITLSMAPVILAITVDYSLHIISHQKHKKNIFETIKDVAFPIIVCGIATAFEFVSLFFVSSEVLKELGIFAAISVFVSAVLTLSILPQFIDKVKQKDYSEKNILENFLDKITHFEFEKYKVIIAVFIVFTAVSIYFAFKVEFDGDMLKMNCMSKELHEAENNLKKINDFTENTAYVVTYGNNFDDALKNNEAEYNILNDLKQNNKIKSFYNLSSLLVSDSTQQQRIKQWKNYWSKSKIDSLKKNIEKYAQIAGFKPNTFNDFINSITKNYNVLNKNEINFLKEQLFKDNISKNNDLVSIVSIIKLSKEQRKQLSSNASESKNSVLIDRQSMLTKYIDNLNNDFGFIANISLLLVLIILIIAFGRIELGFIAFVPIFISWLWTLALMAMFGIKFNIFNIIISSFITGMGVDYSTYIMQGLLQGYSSNNKTLVPFKSNIMVSALITISGTGVLIFAKHPALNSIAIISIIGLVSVVLTAYTFEPLLFNLLVQKNNKKRVVPITLSNLLLTTLAFIIFVTGSLLLNILLFVSYLIPIKVKIKKAIIHYCLMYSCRGLVYLLFPIKKNIINEFNENFKTPSIIISNHQSHIDLVILLMLNPKFVALTTNWVSKNPIYRFVIKFLDFYNINEGNETIVAKLSDKIKDGYSILIFPEGTRSETQQITRFHKGAFYIAKQLNADIIPIFIHGAGDCMRKGENYVRSGKITIKICERIKFPHNNFGDDYRILSKSMQNYYRTSFASIKQEIETVDYFVDTLNKNYIFKGPILEWYNKIKIKLEDNYKLFDKLIPHNAEILDIGCGYGFLPHMLSFVSETRKIHAIDYDKEKIEIAENCISKKSNVTFEYADATKYSFSNKDVFIISDMLHYINETEQEKLITNCINNLNDTGIIILRDANKNLTKRHWGTRYTEFFSTKTGFNKLESGKLHFTNINAFINIANKFKLEYEVIDNTKLTSNIIFIIKKGGTK